MQTPGSPFRTHYKRPFNLRDTLLARASNNVPTPLDRLLNKAKTKHKLSLPGLESDPQEAPQTATPRRPPAKSASGSQAQRRKPPPQRQQGQQQDALDDDALMRDITERERDSVWQSIRVAVEDDEALWDSDGDSGPGTGLPARRRLAPPSARSDGPVASSRGAVAALSQPVASSSGFKGFGSPPASRQPSAAPSSAASASSPSSSSTPTLSPAAPSSPSPSNMSTPTSAMQSGTGAGRAPEQEAAEHSKSSQQKQQRRLGVFLFNAEEARTRALLQELGWGGRVEVVQDLRDADAILAAKLTRSGKHVNLTQGERTASNAGIPFVVVGRNLTADNLRTALEPLLNPGSEAAAAAAERLASRRKPTAAEMQAHAVDLILGFGQMQREGGLPSGP